MSEFQQPPEFDFSFYESNPENEPVTDTTLQFLRSRVFEILEISEDEVVTKEDNHIEVFKEFVCHIETGSISVKQIIKQANIEQIEGVEILSADFEIEVCTDFGEDSVRYDTFIVKKSGEVVMETMEDDYFDIDDPDDLSAFIAVDRESAIESAILNNQQVNELICKLVETCGEFLDENSKSAALKLLENPEQIAGYALTEVTTSRLIKLLDLFIKDRPVVAEGCRSASIELTDDTILRVMIQDELAVAEFHVQEAIIEITPVEFEEFDYESGGVIESVYLSDSEAHFCEYDPDDEYDGLDIIGAADESEAEAGMVELTEQRAQETLLLLSKFGH